jgi:hypothetical protein
MTYTAHNPRLFYDAVIARLVADTGRPVGEAVAPAGGLPYAVVYPMPDARHDGSLADPHQVAVYTFQLTAVGQTMEQAQWMQHKGRVSLLGWIPTVAGIGSTPVQLDDPGGGGVTRDDDVSPPQFYAVDRYRMYASS